MADLQTTVDLIFRGSDQASASINSIGKSVQGFNQNLQNVVGPLASVSKSVLALEGVLIGTAIALGKTAFDAAAKYQSVLVELEKTYSDQNLTIEEFKAQIAALGEQYGVSGVVALESVTSFVKAGNEASEALKLTALSLELAEAAQVDYGLATNTVTIASKSFGLEADELRTKLDFLNTAADTSAVTGAQLVEAFGGAASSAGAAGLSFEQYVARLVPGIERTQQTTEVSRALRAIFVSMIRPTGEQAEVLSNLGVALEDSSGNATLAKDRIEQFFGIVQNATGAQREYTLAVVGGKEQFDRLAAVVGGVEKTQELLNLTQDEYITLLSEFERRAATSEFAVEKLKNAFAALNTTIGQQTQGNIDGVIGSLTGLEQALNDAIASGSLDEVFQAIGAELDILADTIEKIAENLPEALEGVDFSALAESVGDLGEAIRGFFGVDLSTTEGLTRAIQGIVDGITALQNVTIGIIESLSIFVQAFLSLADAGSGLDKETEKLIGRILGFSQGLSLTIPLVNTLLGVLIVLSGPKLFGGLASLISSATTAIVGMAAALGKTGLVGAAGAVGFAFGSFLNDITGLSGKITDLAAEITGLADAERKALAPTEALTGAQSAQLLEFQALTAEYQALLAKGEALTPELVNQAKAFTDTGKAVDLTRQEFDALLAQGEVEKRIQAISEAAVGQAVAMEETASKADLLKRAQQGLIPLTDELIEFWRGGTPEAAKLSDATGTLTEQLDAMGESGEVAKDKIAELRTEIAREEIRARVEFDIAELEQNTERVKAQIQGVVDLAQIRATVDIAEIEAGVEKTKAVLQGLQGVFDVTGNSISELIDAISGVDDADTFARNKIEIFQNALDRQITLQEQALESQIRVNDATVEELRARAQRLRSGNALITINADGMEPELRAVFGRIIELAQIEASSDGALLLGL